MNTKQKIRLLLSFSGMLLFIAGAIILLGFTDFRQAENACRRLQINVVYGSSDTIISIADVDSIVRNISGKVVGKELWRINTQLIEKSLKQQAWISETEVYETHSGTLLINITQCKPVLRVITHSNRSYYLSDRGAILPVRQGHPARIPVASGFIPDSSRYRITPVTNKLMLDTTETVTLLPDLHRLAKYIDSSPFFRAQIDQIYVNRDREIELIPKVGNHIIMLGDISGLEEKFQRLYAFYRYGMSATSWNKYKVVNIKFKNQVVCLKSETL